MKKGDAFMLNAILAKIKITGEGVSSDTRRAVMSSKIAVSAVVKSFEEAIQMIQKECDGDENGSVGKVSGEGINKATYYGLVNDIAIEEVDIELSKITICQFDTLLDKVELTTNDVEMLYKFMLLN